MRFYIIAGEKSGEHYGASLVHALRRLHGESEFFGFGGREMEQAGVILSRRIEQTAIIGFSEVLTRLGTIRKNFRTAKRDLLRLQPNALVLIDYPGFNLRMAEWAKKRGIKVFYYIAPQTWAWKRGRNKVLARYVDRVFTILPFESKNLSEDRVPFQYVGHPMVDDIEAFRAGGNEPVDKSNTTGTSIAVLPGSRKAELIHLLPVLRELFSRLPDHRFLVAAMTDLPRDMYRPVASLPNVELHYDSALEVIHAADTGLIKSGTSTLQAALLGLPQVVFYRINPVSAWIMRKLALIQYVSLPNLIAGKEVVTELLQKDFTIDRLVAELGRLDQKEVREVIGEEYAGIKKQLAKPGQTADIVARSILDLITKAEGNG